MTNMEKEYLERRKSYPGSLTNPTFGHTERMMCHAAKYPHKDCQVCRWMWECIHTDEERVKS